MTTSSTTTVTMNGNSTGYGIAQGTEIFNLAGYYDTVELAGASDTVNVTNGGFDTVDLNDTGFTSGTADIVDLGSSTFDTITTSHVLRFSDVTVLATGGPNTVALDNVAGSTTLYLGNLGDPALQTGLGLGDNVTLNGDATNNVVFSSGGDATVAIGTAGDGQQQGVANVALWGYGNTVTGGDETFTVTNKADPSGLNSVSLGNGNDSVFLAGAHSTVHLGNGNNTLTMYGGKASATIGGGNNVINTGYGSARVIFAAGHAGATETMTLHGGTLGVLGGAENFDITSTAAHAGVIGWLGDGNNTIDLHSGAVRVSFGKDDTNTAYNSVSVTHGGGSDLTFNGGVDTVQLNDTRAGGANTIHLNGTMLGTSLSAAGGFNHITLTDDANAAITDLGKGMDITLDADTAGGFGAISVSGVQFDDLARIHLVGASAYTLSVDNTPVGGITLHFAHGTVDLVGVQSVPNLLFG